MNLEGTLRLSLFFRKDATVSRTPTTCWAAAPLAVGLWSAWILYARKRARAEPQSQRRARAAPRAAQPAATR